MFQLIRRRFSDLLFISALSISAYTLIATYFDRSGLPPGVCPIDNRSTYYTISIGLLIASFIVSLFDKKNKG